MKIEGLKELDAKLRALGTKDGSRAIRTAVLAAGAVIVARARKNAEALRNGSGAFALSLGVRYVRAASEDVPVGRRFVAQIGPRVRDAQALALYNTAYGRKAKGIFYGHLIERGFAHRGGKQVQGQRVLTNALQQTRSQAIAVFTSTLGSRIDSLMKKQARNTVGARASRKAKPLTRGVRRIVKRARRGAKQASRVIARANKRLRKVMKRPRGARRR